MNDLRERQDELTEAEKERIHNERRSENYYKLTNMMFEQFGKETVEEAVEEPVVEEPPLYISPMNVGRLEQAPQVTEYAVPKAAVFTTQKFANLEQNMQTPVEIPTEVVAPVQSVKTEMAAGYSLNPLAKMIIVAFTFLVVAMLTMICVNTQIIRQKSVRIKNLEEKKEQLLQEVQEINARIEAAQSEETIRQYAIENGMLSPAN